MLGIELLEDAICASETASLGPVGTGLCMVVHHFFLEPLNAWVDKHVVKPLVEAADTVEDALNKIRVGFTSLFGF